MMVCTNPRTLRINFTRKNRHANTLAHTHPHRHTNTNTAHPPGREASIIPPLLATTSMWIAHIRLISSHKLCLVYVVSPEWPNNANLNNQQMAYYIIGSHRDDSPIYRGKHSFFFGVHGNMTALSMSAHKPSFTHHPPQPLHRSLCQRCADVLVIFSVQKPTLIRITDCHRHMHLSDDNSAATLPL